MNLLQAACLLLAFCARSRSQEQTYLITAPKLFRIGADENVVVQTTGYESAFQLHISVKSYPDKTTTFDTKMLLLSPDNKFQNKATLKIQPKDITTKDRASLYVYLEATSNSFTKYQRVPITFENGFLFIQTDKPIYTPDQSVKVRVYSLDEELKPPRRNTTLTFVDPEGVKVDQLDAEDFVGIISYPDFKIPVNPKFGTWRIEAAYQKDFSTTGFAQFVVKEYELPGYSVSIEPEASSIGYDKFEAFQITIKASYFYNKKLAQADAYIRFGIINGGERKMLSKSVRAAEIVDGVAEITFNSKWAVKELNYETLEDLDGCYLYITVTVLETPDSRPEETELATVKYILAPYNLKLIATPLFMRPGLPFYIKVQVMDTLENPMRMVPVTLTAEVFGRSIGSVTLVDASSGRSNMRISNVEGMASFSVNIPTDAETMEFTIRTADKNLPDGNQASSTNTATAYFSPSQSYLYIDWVSQYKTLRLDDYVNMNIYPSSHYLHKVKYYSYLIISKGKIVAYGTESRYADSSFQSLNFKLTSDMVPSARLLVYYVLTGDQQAELVADSVWMNVEEKCVNNQKVQLSTDAKSYTPGNDMKLSIRAQTGSFIALSAMDTAIYEVVRKSERPMERVLRAFEKSDLGCGAGGGKDNADVFNLAGLTFITNANVDASTVQEKACRDVVRPKRQINLNEEFDKAVKSYKLPLIQRCCRDGIKEHPSTEPCDKRASRIKDRQFQKRCVEAFMNCCNLAVRLREEDAGKGLILGRMQMRSIFDLDEPQIRSYFPESWMWKTQKLTDRWGSQVVPFTLPDTLTTWEIQGIGMSNQGVCVADPVTVRVFKDVFIKVQMPYSVVRGEQIELIASIYNYRNDKITGCVTLTVGEEICLFKGFSTPVKGIQSTPCSRSVVYASSVTVVKFKVLPLEIGLHSVNFTLKSDRGSEIVLEKLRVVPEGIKKERQIGFTLDPKGVYGAIKRRHEVRYMVPPNVVPKSKIERVMSIRGELLDDVIATVLNPEGVKILTNLPKGSAETELMRVVPIFYVFHYLEVMNEWDILGPLSLTARTDMRRQMKEAILSILSFRNKDFSYSMWKDREASTWLTAFAVRILGQVQNYVPLDQMDMCNTLTWLVDNCQSAEGSFKEKSRVFPVKLTGTLPKDEKEKALYLTAFVLIGIQKAFKMCPTLTIKNAANKAEDFLMNNLLKAESSTFTLAIGAFALALTDHTKGATRQIFAALKREAFVKGDSVYRYWKETRKDVDATTPSAGTAQMVETTAYALLATLHNKEFTYANPIVKWLSEEQRYGGGFYATQDTVNALEAIAEYAMAQKKLDLDMVVKVSYKKGGDFQRYELKDGKYFTKLEEIPLSDDIIISTGSGTGIATGNVKSMYNVISTSAEVCSFDLRIGQRKDTGGRYRRQAFEKPTDADTMYLEACAKYKVNPIDGYEQSGQAVMQISLVSGLEAVEDDLNVLANGVDQLISDYSLADGNVIIHLDSIPSDEYLCVAFRVKQVFKVGMMSPSAFTVYEFHAPDKKCTILYNPYGENELVKLCHGNECKCMEAECSRMQPEINLEINADTRKEKACQADIIYAYKVNIVSSVEDGSFIKYTAVLQEIFKKGQAFVKVNGEVKFIKKKSCTDVVLEAGKQYLMMGKEGFQIQVNFSFQYEYPLDANTWIEWWPPKDACNRRNCEKFINVMEEFTEDILLSGC